MGARLEEAVGNAAGAVRDLPDSSFVVRLTRGRLWIAVLSGLLVGIVALNVLSLGLNVSSGRTGERIATLERENSALRAQIAQRLSNDRIEAAAVSLGLIFPSPADTTYLTAGGGIQHAAGSSAEEPVIAEPLHPATAAPDPTSPPAPTSSPSPTSPPTSPAPPAASPSPSSASGPASGGSGLIGGVAPG